MIGRHLTSLNMRQIITLNKKLWLLKGLAYLDLAGGDHCFIKNLKQVALKLICKIMLDTGIRLSWY